MSAVPKTHILDPRRFDAQNLCGAPIWASHAKINDVLDKDLTPFCGNCIRKADSFFGAGEIKTEVSMADGCEVTTTLLWDI